MKIWFPLIRGWSGTDIFTERLAQVLKDEGFETEITYFSPFYEFAPFLLTKVSAPLGTQIIHTNSWSGFAFKRKNIPLVVTEHHCVFDPAFLPYKSLLQRLYHNVLIRPYEWSSFKAASAVTTVSNYTASSLSQVFDIQNAHVIYNWVDTSFFKPSGSDEKGQRKPFRLLYVGNLSRRKGTDLLRPVMEKLGSDFELHYTSGLRSPHNRLVESENMYSVGSLTGQKLVEAYQGCDAFIFPSRFEGFGLAVLEAMACGKPVIVSNNSALPEVVEDRISGLVCPTDDVNAFVNACKMLAEEHDLRGCYGHKARERALYFFSQNKSVKHYKNLYTSLID